MTLGDEVCGNSVDFETTARPPARVVICDARPLIRLGLTTAFSCAPDLRIVAEATSSDELLQVVSQAHPDLVLVHTRIPPVGALTVVQALAAQFSGMRVLVLADAAEPMVAAEFLRTGASGVAHVSQSATDIIEALRSTLRGDQYVAPTLDVDAIERTMRESPLRSLTPREREIFALLAQGLANAVIARRLYISKRTAETHRQRIMRKLQMHSISDLVLVAKRLEMIGMVAEAPQVDDAVVESTATP